MEGALQNRLTALVCTVLLFASGTAQADQDFSGKTIRIIVGTSPGGGYEAYARLAARYLGSHLAGKPVLIVANMPGASGITACNHLYNVAPKDGTTVATFNRSLPFYQALGQPGLRCKTEELSWIGSLSQTAEVLAVWHTAGIATLEDAKRREVLIGAQSAIGTNSVYPLLMNATLGTRFKIVTGYAGGPEVDLAMEKEEVQGRGANPWTSWKIDHPEWIRDKKIVLLVQMGLKKEPELPQIPLLTDLAQNEEQRRLFTFVSAPQAIERFFALPPGLPPGLLDQFRRAFQAMLADAAFRAEAKRQDMDLDPLTGDQVGEIVASIVRAEPATVEKVRALLAPPGGK